MYLLQYVNPKLLYTNITHDLLWQLNTTVNHQPISFSVAIQQDCKIMSPLLRCGNQYLLNQTTTSSPVW